MVIVMLITSGLCEVIISEHSFVPTGIEKMELTAEEWMSSSYLFEIFMKEAVFEFSEYTDNDEAKDFLNNYPNSLPSMTYYGIGRVKGYKNNAFKALIEMEENNYLFEYIPIDNKDDIMNVTVYEPSEGEFDGIRFFWNKANKTESYWGLDKDKTRYLKFYSKDNTFKKGSNRDNTESVEAIAEEALEVANVDRIELNIEWDEKEKCWYGTINNVRFPSEMAENSIHNFLAPLGLQEEKAAERQYFMKSTNANVYFMQELLQVRSAGDIFVNKGKMTYYDFSLYSRAGDNDFRTKFLTIYNKIVSKCGEPRETEIFYSGEFQEGYADASLETLMDEVENKTSDENDYGFLSFDYDDFTFYYLYERPDYRRMSISWKSY